MTVKIPLRVAVMLAFAAPAAAHREHDCRLLLVNDDGVEAAGIHALYKALEGECEILVVAPSHQQSGMSHAVPNVRAGLHARRVPFENDVRAFAVDGTPAEAAGLGLTALAGGKPFDLVVLGINDGENTGLANLYSGTINAGMEALVRGTPAVAFSQASADGASFDRSGKIARAIVRHVLANPLPAGIMLNINIPAEYSGAVVAPAAGMTVNLRSFDIVDDKDGEMTFRPQMGVEDNPPAGGDVANYLDGRITITPLALDRTAYAALPQLKDLANDLAR